jgi:hypothetical protein
MEYTELISKIIDGKRAPVAGATAGIIILYLYKTGALKDLDATLTAIAFFTIFCIALSAVNFIVGAITLLQKAYLKASAKKARQDEFAADAAEQEARKKRDISHLETLDASEWATLLYAKVAGKRRFQACFDDPILDSLVSLGLAIRGVRTKNDCALFEIPEHVWSTISKTLTRLDERTKESFLSRGAPWELRRDDVRI